MGLVLGDRRANVEPCWRTVPRARTPRIPTPQGPVPEHSPGQPSMPSIIWKKPCPGFAAENLVRRRTVAVEHHLGGVDAPNPSSGFPGIVSPGRTSRIGGASRRMVCGAASRALVGAYQHRHQRRAAAVGQPHLLAADAANRRRRRTALVRMATSEPSSGPTDENARRTHPWPSWSGGSASAPRYRAAGSCTATIGGC